MRRSVEEQAQTKRLEDLYARSRAPVMLAIERRVCGCDFGGNSWTTRAEAERIAAHLRLAPGRRFVDLGAGSGWPAVYMAEIHGSDAVLVDLPLSGLRIAAERARRDGVADRCWTICADAASLPFPAGGFDAVSHSDILCCLKGKRAVLEACRRVVHDGGRMAFTVISIAPGLPPESRRRALENGPEFVEAEADYPTMLRQAGWETIACEDVTRDFGAACRRQLQADLDHGDALQRLVGASEVAERCAEWRSKIAAIDEGLLRRELFVAVPGGPSGRPYR